MKKFKLTCSCNETHDGLVFDFGNTDRIFCDCGSVWEVKLLDLRDTDSTESPNEV
jgi:hypothetical protein